MKTMARGNGERYNLKRTEHDLFCMKRKTPNAINVAGFYRPKGL